MINFLIILLLLFNPLLSYSKPCLNSSLSKSDSRKIPIKRIIFLIPGAASSGNKLYLNSPLNFILKIIGKEKYFKTFQNKFKLMGIDSYICPSKEHKDKITLKQRARLCAKDINLILKKEKRPLKIMLIGHSMGGLVARLIPHQSNLAKKIVIDHILSISSPHKGTILADFALNELKKGGIYSLILKAISFTPKERPYLMELLSNRSTLKDNKKVFFWAQDIQQLKNINYYSISSGSNNLSFDSNITSQIIKKELRKLHLNESQYGDLNDGMIATYSQIYGTYLKNFNISHFESACVDLYKNTKGCKKILKYLEYFIKQKICY